MTIDQIEKSSLEFKTAHKIKVSGPYNGEDIPKWFKDYVEKTDERLRCLEEEEPKWFRAYAEKIDARFKSLEEKFDAKFKNLEEKMDARLSRLEEKVFGESKK